jgi:DNA-binding PadR family transcriptional regulator
VKRRALSELEGCVLGLIGLMEPVTAYAIGKVFLHSPSPQWSGSAGAIYPLVKRLQRSKLICGREQRVGQRGRELLSLMPAGRSALRTWLGPPVPSRIGGVPPDPLRTRVRFLDLLSPLEQISFLKMAQQSTRQNLLSVEADCKRSKPQGGFRYLIALGALVAMEARCEWLREVQKTMSTARKTTK